LAFYPFLSNKSLIKKKVDIAKYQTIPQRPEDTKTTTTTRHIHFVIKVFPFASYYFLISFSLAISLASILTTLTFPSSPFLPRDHYQYYRLVSDVGIALGGLEVVLPSCLFPQHVKILRIRSLWVVVLLHTMLTVFFLCASWFHFLDNAYTLLVLVFVQGVTHGLVVVHAMAMMPRLFHDAREKGAAMGYVHVAFSGGKLAAGLLGVFVEETLKHHCSNALLLGRYCLARIPTTTGWETNVHC